MGWSIGWDSRWNRDIGYGVPAICDHPKCGAEIDRGLAHVCGGEPYGGEHGCGLHFCPAHLWYHTFGRGSNAECVQTCARCKRYRQPFAPKPDHPDLVHHKATDPSWAEWRAKEVAG